jgi:membrane protein
MVYVKQFNLRSFSKIFLQRWRHGDVGVEAAGLSYTVVLSIVPFLAAFLTMAKAFDNLYTFVNGFKGVILRYLTIGTGQAFTNGIDAAVVHLDFSRSGWIGLSAAIITSLIMINTINMAIQRIWDVKETRRFPKRLVIYFALVLFGPIGAAILMAAATSRYALVGSILPSSGPAMLYLTVMLFLVNKWVPNIKVGTVPALIGSVVTALALIVLQQGFVKVAITMLKYDQLYGSLASVALFLFWLYLVWYTILLGVTLNASLNFYSWRRPGRFLYAERGRNTESFSPMKAT